MGNKQANLEKNADVLSYWQADPIWSDTNADGNYSQGDDIITPFFAIQGVDTIRAGITHLGHIDEIEGTIVQQFVL